MKKKVPVQKATVASANNNKLRRILGLFIFAFAFLLYAQSISFDYAADDSSVTSANKLTTQGLKGIPEILKTDYWYGTGGLRVPQYRPLPLVLLALEWEFFPANPHVSHLINVLLYALTCWLLFVLLYRLFGAQNLIFPFVVILLFAAHPVHTEVVNNIKSGDEILCFLFANFSCLFLLKYISESKTTALIFAFIFYFISLLAKETSIAFLFLAPLMLYFFTKASTKKITSAFIIYLSATGLFLLTRAAVLSGESFSGFDSILNNSLYGAPDFISRIATAFFILFKYLVLLFFPHPLSYDYSYSQIKTQSLTDVGSLAGIILYLIIGVLILVNIRKKNIPAFSLLFYLLTLAPVSNIFILIGATMAERFMYMPSLGFCILISFLFIKLFKSDQVQSAANNLPGFFSSYKPLLAVVFIITIFYTSKTFVRSKDWKNDITLFSNDVKIATNSTRAHYNWGTVLLQQLYPKENDPGKKNKILDSALAEFNQAVAIYPGYSDAYINRAFIYKNKGDYKNAIQNFEMAKSNSRPKAGLYFDLGNSYLEDGQYEKAIEAFDSGLSLNTLQPDVIYNNKGIALFKLQKYEEAIPAFQKVIDMNPGFQSAYRNLGFCYANLKQYPEGIRYLKDAVRIDSSDENALNALVTLYKFTGDTLNLRIYSEIQARTKR